MYAFRMRKKMIDILGFALLQRDTVQIKDFAILAVAFLCMFQKISCMKQLCVFFKTFSLWDSHTEHTSILFEI